MIKKRIFGSASGTTVILAQGLLASLRENASLSLTPESKITGITQVPSARRFLRINHFFRFLHSNNKALFVKTIVPTALLKRHIDFNHGINSVAKITVVPMALLLICFYALKAAVANPVNSLRTELCSNQRAAVSYQLENC